MRTVGQSGGQMRGELDERGQMRMTTLGSRGTDEDKANREVDKDDKDVSGRET